MSWWPISGRWRVPSLAAAGVLVLVAMALVALAAASGYTTSVTNGGSAHPGGRGGPAGAGGGPHPAPTTTPWTVYHGSPDGSGVATSSATFSSPRLAWTSPALDGQTYGEPLEADGRVIVATENDTVYALAAHSGAVLWSTHLGSPVPAGQLPCGDIRPTVGITGTPVIDAARQEVFVVADEQSAEEPAHHLIGLDLVTGAVRLDEPADPAGTDPADLLQRTALALDGGHVVFGYGGNYGDCGAYHGWVVAMPETGGAAARFEVDAAPGERQGAIWMGGAAPEVDATGNIWVAAGNGSVTAGSAPYDGSDSVDELSPALQLEQRFAPSRWRADNAGDEDLGSTPPALLADGTVFQVGKSQTGYLLSAGHLGGVGGEETSGHVCSADADGGDAVSGDVVYVGCRSGVEAVRVGSSPAAVTVEWTGPSGATGPPILAGGLVWSIGGGILYGLAPDTGTVDVRLPVGTETNHFSTPSVGDGLLLAPGGTGSDAVLAFSGSAGTPPPPRGGTAPTTAG